VTGKQFEFGMRLLTVAFVVLLAIEAFAYWSWSR
jgi:hypothetical protein